MDNLGFPVTSCYLNFRIPRVMFSQCQKSSSDVAQIGLCSHDLCSELRPGGPAHVDVQIDVQREVANGLAHPNQKQYIGVSFHKWGYPQSSPILKGFSVINIYKPSILGYPHDYGTPHSHRTHKIHPSTETFGLARPPGGSLHCHGVSAFTKDVGISMGVLEMYSQR